MSAVAASCTRPRIRPYRRPVLPFRPRWQGAIEGYAHNTINRYLPTLHCWYERQDIMQEAYIVFMTCEQRYGGHVDNASWFMALYKTALHNRLVTLVVSVPRYSLSVEDVPEPICPDVAKELWELTRDLPRELQIVLGDICRLRPRFNFSKRAIRELRVALVQPLTAQGA